MIHLLSLARVPGQKSVYRSPSEFKSAEPPLPTSVPALKPHVSVWTLANDCGLVCKGNYVGTQEDFQLMSDWVQFNFARPG